MFSLMIMSLAHYNFFFFNDTATTEIYTLSLHDALPIYLEVGAIRNLDDEAGVLWRRFGITEQSTYVLVNRAGQDRKSTRLNSSHANISYAVFCLKKKSKIKSIL